MEKNCLCNTPALSDQNQRKLSLFSILAKMLWGDNTALLSQGAFWEDQNHSYLSLHRLFWFSSVFQVVCTLVRHFGKIGTEALN